MTKIKLNNPIHHKLFNEDGTRKRKKYKKKKKHTQAQLDGYARAGQKKREHHIRHIMGSTYNDSTTKPSIEDNNNNIQYPVLQSLDVVGASNDYNKIDTYDMQPQGVSSMQSQDPTFPNGREDKRPVLIPYIFNQPPNSPQQFPTQQFPKQTFTKNNWFTQKNTKKIERLDFSDERDLINSFSPTELADKMRSKIWRMNNLYYIVDEFGSTIPFHFNFIQSLIWQEKGWRNVILKYRQGGVSTLFIIDQMDDVLFGKDNTTNYFITHRQDLLDEFFKKAKFTFDSMNSKVKALIPKPKTDNANELYWDKSNNTLKISLDLRGKTPTKVHISEFAWMPVENQKKLYIAMNEVRNTSISIESTANGLGDVFYTACMNARAGIGVYKLLFYPFDIDDRNELDVPEGWIPSEADKFFANSFLSDYPYEKMIRKLYWRRTKIDTTSAVGDNGEKVFNQENPITIDHAFISSGSMVFDLEQDYQIQKCYKEIEGFKLFEHPCDELIIGVDIAEGGQTGDYSTISARRKDGKTAFQFRGKVNEIILAQKLDFILNYSEKDSQGNEKKYKGAIYPENNTGLAFINECKKYKWFQFILKMRKQDDVKDDNIQQKYGFRMTASNKDLIIREYRGGLYNKSIWITPEVYSEIRTYQYDKDNRPNAIRPNYDDLLVADMIAYNGILHENWVVKYKPTQNELEDMTYLQRLRYKMLHSK